MAALFLSPVKPLPVQAQSNLAPGTESLSRDTTAAADLLSGARYRLINGNQPGARLALEELAAQHPDYHRTERMLLRARWYLEEGDTVAFDDGYWQVLETSLTDDDFAALLNDTAPIFTPVEAQQWENLDSPQSKASFLRKFWRSRDPDPIDMTNPRLITHYIRLLEAQKSYSGPVYGSPRRSRNHGAGQPQQFNPTAPLVDFPFQQPKPEFKRPSSYELDSRGLLYLRHGPPNRIVQGTARESNRELETWFYGGASFTFEGLPGSDSFIAVPGGSADVENALQSESVLAEKENDYQHYYAAEFKGDADSVVLEFYQSFPADSLEVLGEPGAVVALFDTSWNQVTISKSPARKMTLGENSHWVAVNRLAVEPGIYYCAMRMDLNPEHPVIRNSMVIRAFAKDSLNLSGIIFGSPQDIDETIRNRSREGLLPRPSLIFTAGEEVSVYYEIYGLKPSRDGERTYSEMITVSRVPPEDHSDKDSFSGNAERLKRWSENRANSLSLFFERSADRGQKNISEYFVVNTANLEPGSYRLQLEVEDDVSGELRDVTWFFDLAGPPVIEYKPEF
ncbi:MAG: hypothetical protein FVQ81_17445 [Candidatus Glassbacteria bacterium]|nr:hypothetical protein [Candidatus Glassbacteria bacterium]